MEDLVLHEKDIAHTGQKCVILVCEQASVCVCVCARCMCVHLWLEEGLAAPAAGLATESGWLDDWRFPYAEPFVRLINV